MAEKAKKIRCIEGTKDIFGEDMNRFSKIMKNAESVFSRFGYLNISTPVFENTNLFCRSIGEVTDIVEKEMYTFTPGSDTITLRPEGTAGVVRSYLQHNMHKEQSLKKLCYAGPMFRRERPQKGRQRQFHQVGIEAIGSDSAMLDAEVILTALEFYSSLGIDGIKTKLNTIGCLRDDCRPAYREALKKAIEPELPNLCKNCQSRFNRNILRIIDCKNPKCQEIREKYPRCDEYLCTECNDHKEIVEEVMTASGEDFVVDPFIVRGLDYYTKTVFEFSHPSLGAQDAIGAGGRYDGLVETLGGPQTPAVGFAIGVERMMIAMEELNCCACSVPLQVFGIATGETEKKSLSGLLSRLRKSGISCDMDFEGRSMKSQMRKANKLSSTCVIILGEEELKNGTITIKDMREGGNQQTVPFDEMVDNISRLTEIK
ncbi:MAG: histidine--tRNA ligase [Planctomycetota bacterium]|jgi:histidyl-tRNA synthetase